jgi:Ni/Fe-hydrogenase subunit HybB-like protein
MKKNTFYLIFGCIALALLTIFWYSVELHAPILIEIAFIIGIALVYLAKRKVTDIINDERDVNHRTGNNADHAGLLGRILCIFDRSRHGNTSCPDISPPGPHNASC